MYLCCVESLSSFQSSLDFFITDALVRYLKQRKLKSQLKKRGIRIDDAEGLDFEDLQGRRQ